MKDNYFLLVVWFTMSDVTLSPLFREKSYFNVLLYEYGEPKELLTNL